MLLVRKFKNVNPLLSVIIINYNSEKFFEIVRMCIKAALEIPIPKEIIVIDNGSTDSSRSFLVDYIKNISEEDGFYCSALKLLFINKNIGFQNAINVATKLLDSTSKYLVIINNDFVIDGRSIASLIRILERVSRIGLIQGKILKWDRITIDSAGCIITVFGDWLKLGHGMSRSLFNFPLIVSYVHAACFICRREVFSGFLPEFFVFGDDFELGPRLYAQGYCCLYYPVDAGWHYGSATSVFNKDVAELTKLWSVIGTTAILRLMNPTNLSWTVLGLIRALLDLLHSTLTPNKTRTLGIILGFSKGLRLRLYKYKILKRNAGRSIEVPTLKIPLKDLPNLLLRKRRQSYYLKYITNYVIGRRIRIKAT